MENKFLLLWGVIPTIIWAIIMRIIWMVFINRRNKKRGMGFFHPYTNDGGGGEKVLSCVVKAVQELSPDLHCVVYTRDHAASPHSLVGRALNRFGLQLLYPPKVVHLYKRKLIEETTYPRFTMIGQIFGSVYLSWETLCKFTPFYYFNTSGYAFTYPVARMFGSCAHLAMLKYSWTEAHIEKLWRITNRTKRVYPLCDTSRLQVLPLERLTNSPKIIFVAQFRPEKVAILRKPYELKDEVDEKRLQNLKDQAVELNVEEDVEF